MELPDVQATSELYWLAALIAALMDLGLAWPLVWQIRRDRFRQIKWPLLGTSALFWGSLWAAVMSSNVIWASSYQYVFPGWARWAMPGLMAAYYGLVAFFFWWLALRLPGNTVINFLLLGGLISLPGHLWAIYGRQILETSLLRGASSASVLIFGIFEFILYWILVLTIAVLLQLGWKSWSHLRQRRAPRIAS